MHHIREKIIQETLQRKWIGNILKRHLKYLYCSNLILSQIKIVTFFEFLKKLADLLKKGTDLIQKTIF